MMHQSPHCFTSIPDGLQDFCSRHKVDVQRVLDAGCGAGESTRWLAASFPGAHVTGADISAHFLALAELRRRSVILPGFNDFSLCCCRRHSKPHMASIHAASWSSGCRACCGPKCVSCVSVECLAPCTRCCPLLAVCRKGNVQKCRPVDAHQTS